jgi:ABC-type transporter MlaC component
MKAFIKLTTCIAIVGFLLSCASTPHHPNLAEAQRFVQQAIDRVSDAQRANNFDMKGHAARAKALMQQAIEEIRLAEQAADGQ